MKKWYSNLLVNTNPQGRNAFNIAVIILLAVIVGLPAYIIALIQDGAGQYYASLVGLAILCILSVSGAVVARQNRVNHAVGLILAGTFFIIPFLTVLFSGLGFVLGSTLLVITALIVGQTLSGKESVKYLLTAGGLTVLTMFTDLYAPWQRLSFPAIQAISPYIVAGVILFMSVALVRQFPTYSLRTKLITIILGIAVVSVSAVAYVTNLAVTYQ